MPWKCTVTYVKMQARQHDMMKFLCSTPKTHCIPICASFSICKFIKIPGPVDPSEVYELAVDHLTDNPLLLLGLAGFCAWALGFLSEQFMY